MMKDDRYEAVIKLTYKCENEKFFGPGIAELLELVEKSASLKEACREMGLSYSKGRGIVKRAETLLGYPLLDKQHGGLGGGASSLTKEGLALLKDYRLLEEDIRRYAEKRFHEVYG